MMTMGKDENLQVVDDFICADRFGVFEMMTKDGAKARPVFSYVSEPFYIQQPVFWSSRRTLAGTWLCEQPKTRDWYALSSCLVF